jgi:hypothetical protein
LLALAMTGFWLVAPAHAAVASANALKPTPLDFGLETVRALAWPLVAVVIALVFRRPLALFFSTIGGRITKLSLLNVELELVPATPAASTPLLDDIRSVSLGAEISDSSRMLLDQVQSTSPADFALIALGEGEEWITSRLYLAATMMERMRGVRVFVFVEGAEPLEQRFVALAPVRDLRWTLAQRYPWLDAAWLRANLDAYPSAGPPQGTQPRPDDYWPPDPQSAPAWPAVVTSSGGAFDPYQARLVAMRFIQSLQKPIPPPKAPANPPAAQPQPAQAQPAQAQPAQAQPAQAEPAQAQAALVQTEGWIALNASTQERGVYVTRKLLASWLPRSAFDDWADEARDAPRGRRTRAVLRRPGDFVALVDADRNFVRLANRRALLEELAGPLAEEPEP